MNDIDYSNHPMIIFDEHLHADNRSGRVTRALVEALKKLALSIIGCHTAKDALDHIAYSPKISALVFDWDSLPNDSEAFIEKVQFYNEKIPIFVLTQQHAMEDVDFDDLQGITGFIWKYADTPDFIAGRIKDACHAYLESLYPPFFKALVDYAEICKYAWHTPGHMGGVAFLKSPIGQLFYDFFGENVFRSDLSISVPELGSLMEHSGANGEAERFAAQTFGADKTYFVTNGTSTSNKMVLMGSVTKGDVAIVDRNCHKSLQHALTMADVIPIYFKPTRNAYGIIGGIPRVEFTKNSIAEKIAASPLIADKSQMPKIAVVTNSTYDGLIYNVNAIKDILSESTIPVLHFDEAWYPYAHFHPFYSGKYAMSDYHEAYHPNVFSTQSTHKLLAAFSQASMVHYKAGATPINQNLFNETYMMHTSTSPQYSIIASLDIATKMVSGQFGYRLINESMHEAISFRQAFEKICKKQLKYKSWFFKLWQPDGIDTFKLEPDRHYLHLESHHADFWELKTKQHWHGFTNIDASHMYLDPIKVTILTPGIDEQGNFTDFGIPAPIVSKFLMNHGVVDEKTGFYCMLFLFSIGVNKSKAMTLLADLARFKDIFSAQVPVLEIFPDLNSVHYQEMSLQQLAAQMHAYLRTHHASEILTDAFDLLPEQVITPNAAYQHIVRGEVELVLLDDLLDRVILTMVAPYPPGIPVIMPGEKITARTKIIVDYLQLLEGFDIAFPGFENEVHGVIIKQVNGVRKYAIHCRGDGSCMVD